jgi:hypothetical protein
MQEGEQEQKKTFRADSKIKPEIKEGQLRITVEITAITLRQFSEFLTTIPFPETPLLVFGLTLTMVVLS